MLDGTNSGHTGPIEREMGRQWRDRQEGIWASYMALKRDTSPVTVAAAVDRYVGALVGRGAATNTVKAYAHDLRHFSACVPAELDAVDPEAIRAFLAEDG